MADIVDRRIRIVAVENVGVQGPEAVNLVGS